MQYVYVDESGWNLHLHRRKGRSAKGDRAVVSQKVSKGANITLIAAVSPTIGLVNHVVRIGSTNAGVFADFMAETVQNAVAKSKPGTRFTFVMDNAKFHHAEDVKRAVPAPHQIEYNPPYSPFLNPIETIFSVWKNQIKLTRLSDADDLTVMINRVVKRITAEEVARHCNHLAKFVVPCVNGLRIVGDAPSGEAPTFEDAKSAVDEEMGVLRDPLPLIESSVAAVAAAIAPPGALDLPRIAPPPAPVPAAAPLAPPVPPALPAPPAASARRLWRSKAFS